MSLYFCIAVVTNDPPVALWPMPEALECCQLTVANGHIFSPGSTTVCLPPYRSNSTSVESSWSRLMSLGSKAFWSRSTTLTAYAVEPYGAQHGQIQRRDVVHWIRFSASRYQRRSSPPLIFQAPSASDALFWCVANRCAVQGLHGVVKLPLALVGRSLSVAATSPFTASLTVFEGSANLSTSFDPELDFACPVGGRGHGHSCRKSPPCREDSGWAACGPRQGGWNVGHIHVLSVDAGLHFHAWRQALPPDQAADDAPTAIGEFIDRAPPAAR